VFELLIVIIGQQMLLLQSSYLPKIGEELSDFMLWQCGLCRCGCVCVLESYTRADRRADEFRYSSDVSTDANVTDHEEVISTNAKKRTPKQLRAYSPEQSQSHPKRTKVVKGACAPSALKNLPPVPAGLVDGFLTSTSVRRSGSDQSLCPQSTSAVDDSSVSITPTGVRRSGSDQPLCPQSDSAVDDSSVSITPTGVCRSGSDQPLCPQSASAVDDSSVSITPTGVCRSGSDQPLCPQSSASAVDDSSAAITPTSVFRSGHGSTHSNNVPSLASNSSLQRSESADGKQLGILVPRFVALHCYIYFS